MYVIIKLSYFLFCSCRFFQVGILINFKSFNTGNQFVLQTLYLVLLEGRPSPKHRLIALSTIISYHMREIVSGSTVTISWVSSITDKSLISNYTPFVLLWGYFLQTVLLSIIFLKGFFEIILLCSLKQEVKLDSEKNLRKVQFT